MVKFIFNNFELNVYQKRKLICRSKRICGCLLKRELKHEGLQINSTLRYDI